jgi:hypothetical protein
MNASPDQRNASDAMKTSTAAAVDAAIGGKDYSNGATVWDGRDLKFNSHRFGLHISSPDHDIYNVGDRPLSHRENGSVYRRETTGAAGQTVFMRIYPTFVRGGGRAF